MALIWRSKDVVDEVQAAALFNALAHPIRLRIVRLLLEQEPRGCQEIVASLPLAQSTISQHLKVLKQAGIVSDRAEGTRRNYSFREDALDRLRMYLSGLGI